MVNIFALAISKLADDGLEDKTKVIEIIFNTK